MTTARLYAYELTPEMRAELERRAKAATLGAIRDAVRGKDNSVNTATRLYSDTKFVREADLAALATPDTVLALLCAARERDELRKEQGARCNAFGTTQLELAVVRMFGVERELVELRARVEKVEARVKAHPPTVPAAGTLELLFTEPPGPGSKFVEAEVNGAGVNCGEWVHRDGYWRLCITRESLDAALAKLE